MGDAATPVLPDFTSQTAAAYKANIDAGFAVADRIAWAFAPHEQSTPDMTVRLDAGSLFDGTTLTEKAAQSTGTITAPTTNPRIDRVSINIGSGAVAVTTGTEAPSPSPPAIPANNIPVAQVALVVSQTSIVNADITDERHLSVPLNINNLTQDTGPDLAADFVATYDASEGIAQQDRRLRFGHPHAVPANGGADRLDQTDDAQRQVPAGRQRRGG